RIHQDCKTAGERERCGSLRLRNANDFRDDALRRKFCKHRPFPTPFMLQDAPSSMAFAWLGSRFTRAADGIWRAREVEPVSYLEGGHALCFECEEGSFWFAHRNHCLRALVRRFPPARALFHIGGGNGRVSTASPDAGFEVVLVEPGTIGARHAAGRGIPTVICA